MRQKEALDWPLAAASVALTMKGARWTRHAIVLGHVAPTPWHAAAAERVLVGKPINAANAEAAGKGGRGRCQPLSQNAYKVQLAKTAVKRALLDAAKEGLTMERPGQQKASMNRCEKLRWKGMFIEADRDPNSPPSNPRPFWCQHTFKRFGPDGQGSRRVRVLRRPLLLRAIVKKGTDAFIKKCVCPLFRIINWK